MSIATYWFHPTGWKVWHPRANSPCLVTVTKYSGAVLLFD